VWNKRRCPADGGNGCADHQEKDARPSGAVGAFWKAEEAVMAQALPRVSIGMPVYNGAQYIREALDSLLAQTFTDFELIISDNASTDNTQAICEEYARRDSRIRYVRQSENIGATSNFSFVLNQARSDLFMWAAHDDLWAPDFLMDGVKLLANADVNFVFPSFELRSIRLGIGKKMDAEIFKFVELPDKRSRVLSFIALHYLSHSANIVYSLFRTDFIRKAYSKQDIGNDGLLGAVILSIGRGAVSNSLFSKRYRTIWPGMLPPMIYVFKGWLRKRDVIAEGCQAIQKARQRVLCLFPEYEREISFIFDRYRHFTHDRFYRVCSISEVL
jgi:glycosyltransferase involved in cell wall biosynthesis